MLNEGSRQFAVHSQKLKKKYWWKNVKVKFLLIDKFILFFSLSLNIFFLQMWILLIVVVLIIIVIIVGKGIIIRSILYCIFSNLSIFQLPLL